MALLNISDNDRSILRLLRQPFSADFREALVDLATHPAPPGHTRLIIVDYRLVANETDAVGRAAGKS